MLSFFLHLPYILSIMENGKSAGSMIRNHHSAFNRTAANQLVSDFLQGVVDGFHFLHEMQRQLRITIVVVVKLAMVLDIIDIFDGNDLFLIPQFKKFLVPTGNGWKLTTAHGYFCI